MFAQNTNSLRLPESPFQHSAERSAYLQQYNNIASLPPPPTGHLATSFVSLAAQFYLLLDDACHLGRLTQHSRRSENWRPTSTSSQR
ncbi:hypothetical protein H112_03825 [Trichophyton rubrum D6]|uniref:Uncharacterized protein n=1 Tax=Trichophyton rubrum CBS 288.86 TaxID=1215330 RepID=A0A022W4E6_TRIRU|nr:hypothetical protein H103_03836 [Trichophyton rubrum CBS 288.86]EZG17452.1 hypothetical protein H107_03944 [Trichophyton rubrum CBS 202.88]KDB34309.1 hypothetical protein H112_03825 [Trichophyton rubrum D6]